MRSTLHLKFLVAYIIFGFLSIFSAVILSSHLAENILVSSMASGMNQEASLYANESLQGYFDDTQSPLETSTQLRGISTYEEASVWLTDTAGTILLHEDPAEDSLDYSVPDVIPDFDPAETGNHSSYLEGDYHGLFSETVITIITPVTSGFTTQGYLILHKPISSVQRTLNRIQYMVYAILCVILILSLIILITFQLFVYIPLRKITEAATQYADGNLDYRIPVNSEDEMGYLSASLNFMADHLKNMQDYQKQFIGNISHDFRSPLTSIKGYVEAMADGTIPPEMQEKYLKIILFETERLTDLTTDLLTLNQFDTNKLHLNRTVFDLHEVIKNTVASFEGICKTRMISFELLLAVKELLVYADKGKIQQVVYNLIDNAIKFSENDTIITIETTDRQNSVLVSIRDNGVGIPKQNLPKIWDRFYKSDLSRGKDKKGTGLGLAIVKEIIQAHSENIHAVSTEGVGTEFSFTLAKPQKGAAAK